jgi:hypothetical protein
MWVLHGHDSREYICGFCMDRIAGCTIHMWVWHGKDSRVYICGFGMERIAGCTYVGLA